ncbi:unnamed protein product [Musa acuminata subsp. burmannicoides]
MRRLRFDLLTTMLQHQRDQQPLWTLDGHLQCTGASSGTPWPSRSVLLTNSLASLNVLSAHLVTIMLGVAEGQHRSDTSTSRAVSSSKLAVGFLLNTFCRLGNRAPLPLLPFDSVLDAAVAL